MRNRLIILVGTAVLVLVPRAVSGSGENRVLPAEAPKVKPVDPPEILKVPPPIEETHPGAEIRIELEGEEKRPAKPGEEPLLRDLARPGRAPLRSRFSIFSLFNEEPHTPFLLAGINSIHYTMNMTPEDRPIELEPFFQRSGEAGFLLEAGSLSDLAPPTVIHMNAHASGPDKSYFHVVVGVDTLREGDTKVTNPSPPYGEIDNPDQYQLGVMAGARLWLCRACNVGYVYHWSRHMNKVASFFDSDLYTEYQMHEVQCKMSFPLGRLGYVALSGRGSSYDTSDLFTSPDTFTGAFDYYPGRKFCIGADYGVNQDEIETDENFREAGAHIRVYFRRAVGFGVRWTQRIWESRPGGGDRCEDRVLAEFYFWR